MGGLALGWAVPVHGSARISRIGAARPGAAAASRSRNVQYDDIIGWLWSRPLRPGSLRALRQAQHSTLSDLSSISQSQAPLQKRCVHLYMCTTSASTQARVQFLGGAERKAPPKHTVFQRDPNAGGCFTSTDPVGDEPSDRGRGYRARGQPGPTTRGGAGALGNLEQRKLANNRCAQVRH